MSKAHKPTTSRCLQAPRYADPLYTKLRISSNRNFLLDQILSFGASKLLANAADARIITQAHFQRHNIKFQAFYLDTRLFIDLLIWGIHLNDCYLHRPLRLHQSLVDLNWRSSHRQGTGSMAGSRQFKVWSHSILRKKHRLVWGFTCHS